MGYANPELDRILELARVERDQQARFELYHQAEEIIIEDAPWVPLWHDRGGFVLLKPYVKDYKLLPLIIPMLRHVYFTDE